VQKGERKVNSILIICLIISIILAGFALLLSSKEESYSYKKSILSRQGFKVKMENSEMAYFDRNDIAHNLSVTYHADTNKWVLYLISHGVTVKLSESFNDIRTLIELL
jgi:Na+-transporting NADH:ubiquinone oxidoreductase subunit NqrC